jgi:nitroreductase
MAEAGNKPADTSVPVSPLIARRWSPRALDETAELSDDSLRALLEAARWAPSFGNTQPARYLAGRRGDDTFDRILGTLNRGNQSWAHRAAALFIGVMVTSNEKGDIPYAEYGLALASQNLVLQAVHDGLVAHQMAGFDPDKVRAEFSVPGHAVPRVAIAVGKPAPAEVLADERNIAREQAPRSRIPLGEFAFRESWGTSVF